MTFVAQVEHHAARIDLGEDERALYVFQCESDPGMCESWSWSSGANACLVLDAHDRTRGPTAPPDGVAAWTESRVTAWTEHDDGVALEDAPQFFSDERIPDTIDQVHQDTKVGSVPSWVQSAEEGPGADWRFVLQISEARAHDGAAPIVGASFGGGTAYVFVRPTTRRGWQRARDGVEAVMLWQAT